MSTYSFGFCGSTSSGLSTGSVATGGSCTAPGISSLYLREQEVLILKTLMRRPLLRLKILKILFDLLSYFYSLHSVTTSFNTIIVPSMSILLSFIAASFTVKVASLFSKIPREKLNGFR